MPAALVGYNRNTNTPEGVNVCELAILTFPFDVGRGMETALTSLSVLFSVSDG